MEKKQVSRKHLQLVGVAAMHIASKVEEVWAPQVADWVYICDKAYTKVGGAWGEDGCSGAAIGLSSARRAYAQYCSWRSRTVAHAAAWPPGLPKKHLSLAAG